MRLWSFAKRTYLNPEDEAWHAETWAWLLRHFGGRERLLRSPLVTPTRDFFPASSATGHERAEHVFAQVKRHAGMAEWPCDLVAQPASPELRVGEVAALRLLRGRPLGTFSVEGNRAVITYDPATVNDPLQLVATLAHELCHYRLAAVGDAVPGGAEMEEYATDLATVFFGYGAFGAACAFRFRQHGDSYSQGWKSERAGYLRPRDWTYALAYFFQLRGEPIEPAKPFLTPALWTDLRAAAAYLRRRPELCAAESR